MSDRRTALAATALLIVATLARAQPDDALGSAAGGVRALRDVWALSPEEAARRAEDFNQLAEGAPDATRWRPALLAAVALERAGQTDRALAAYEALAAQPGPGAGANTATFRLWALGRPESEEFYRRQVATPSRPTVDEGWFLLPDGWKWGSRQQAALQPLLRARSGWLSVRCLRYLRSLSPFRASYSYLFTLLLLTAGLKALELPLSVRKAKYHVQVRRLMPQILDLRKRHVDNPLALLRALHQLCARHSVLADAGLAVLILDIGFVIFAANWLGDFAPQLRLDGARFLWLDDVTRWSAVLTVAAVLAYLGLRWRSETAGPLRSRRTRLSFRYVILAGIVMGDASFRPPPGTYSYPYLIVAGGVVAVAWFFQWPAYVFVLWLLVSAAGAVTHRLLRPLVAAVTTSPDLGAGTED
jgi:hypothetical protein